LPPSCKAFQTFPAFVPINSIIILDILITVANICISIKIQNKKTGF
jgi:hypothetical protein